MAIEKKQYEFSISGRVLANDTSAIDVSQDNLTTNVDNFVINGVDVRLSDLTIPPTLSTTVLNIISDIKNIVATLATNLFCSFALNADNTEVLSNGYNQSFAKSEDEQTLSITFSSIDTNVTHGAWTAGSWEGAGAKIPLTGKRAIEFEYSFPTIESVVFDRAKPILAFKIDLYALPSWNSPVTIYYSKIANPFPEIEPEGPNKYSFFVNNNSEGTPLQVINSNTGPTRIGLYYDATLSEFSIYFDGVVQTLGNNYFDTVDGEAILIVEGIYDALGAIDQGKSGSIRIITDGAEMTGTYPEGTTDICGNVI